MHKIDAAGAWDQSTGSSSIIVADIDTGVDRNHEDLAGQMWVNSAETPNNGVDDDGNGYVDDYYGWDWVNNDNDPMDDHGHGTHTVGTIAAVGNNSKGVVGVNWTSKIMALKFLSSGGSGSFENGVKALQYAADMGAKVSSNSWGCLCQSAIIEDAVKYEHDAGMVVAAAAGNDNADALDHSPASADYAVAVAASDANDGKASFSNWGEKIDVAAPGVDILSLKAAVSPMCATYRTVGSKYCRVDGTSMATPHVAGLAALLLAKNPSLNNEEVRQVLREGSDDLGTAGKDKDFGYGRINANKALNLSGSNPLTPIITSPNSRTLVTGSQISIFGSVPGPNFASYKIEVGAGRTPSSWELIKTSNTQIINGTLATIDSTKLLEGLNIIRVTATDNDGKNYQFQVHDIEVDNFNAQIDIPKEFAPKPVSEISGTVETKNTLTLSSYKLEWGEGLSPTTYSNSGINLRDNGTQPVSSGLLGTWDTSSLTDGHYYTLRLTATATNGASAIFTVSVSIDANLVSGWPKIIEGEYYTYNSFLGQNVPAFVDLDGNGSREILAAAHNKIFAFNKDGTIVQGYPIVVDSKNYFDMPLNVDDLDGDGRKEIMASAKYDYGWVWRKLFVFNSDGTTVSGWPKTYSGVLWDDNNTPATADLDGDSQKEMVLFDGVGNLYAYRLDGSQLPGFPKQFASQSTLVDSVAIVDLDDDENLEIAFGSENKFYLLDHNGNPLPGWPFTSSPVNGNTIYFRSTPAVGDIDGDGHLEIFAEAYSRDCEIFNDLTCTNLLYGWGKNGTLLSGWPKEITQGPWCCAWGDTPSAADLDKDGKDEVYIGTHYLRAYDLSGEKPLPLIRSYRRPAISDVDGDGELEVSVIGPEKMGFVNKEGSFDWKRTNYGDDSEPIKLSVTRSPVIADVDKNGRMEILAIGTPANENYVLVYLWELNADGAASVNEWPIFGHDPAQTSRLEWPPDTTSPIVSISSPKNGATVSGAVNISGLATDDVGISSVEFYVDGSKKSTDTTFPYSYNWNTTAVSEGPHTLSAKAYDAAGNIGTSSSVTVSVDNTDPTVSITSPTSGQLVSGSTAVTATAADNNAVTKVEFYVDGNLKTTDTSSPYSYSWDTTTIADGSHALTAKAYDAANNVGTSKTVTVTVDNTKPTASISSPASGKTVSGTVAVTAAAKDVVGVTKVEFYVGNTKKYTDTTSTYTYKWDTTKVSNGKYKLLVKAHDAAGHVGTSLAVTVNVSNKLGVPKRKLGDLNGDSRINIRDLSILLSRWATTKGVADINRDGRVNIRDLSILLSRWGR
jgi:hypothetical protein